MNPLKKLFLLSTSFCILSIADCQLHYWQQQVNYTIDVSLNDKEHTLDGFERVEYINNSPDTLRFIWFHLWPNAYKNDKTAFSDQTLENGSAEFYFADKENRGYINRLDFKVNNITAAAEDHPQHIDIIKLVLPSPLPPGEKAVITTPFHVKLPKNFSRGGHDGQHYYIAHWYPKPAVYDKKGWHPIPLLDQGEFYSEFGNYNVRITLPENYAVAATGELQEEEEKKWLENRLTFEWKPVTEKVKIKGVTKNIVRPFPESSAKTKTLTYIQENVHDFAWFADKRFVVEHDVLQLSSGKTVDCFSFHFPDQRQWQNSINYIKTAVNGKSKLLGEYPYKTVTVVQSTENVTGGTEFPTITILNAPTESLLGYIISHETGHNWLYGILANNEREFPWLDEGINSYYDYRYLAETPDAGIIKTGKTGHLTIEKIEAIFLKTKEAVKLDQPVSLPAEKYNSTNYNLLVYHKTARWMQLLERKLGKETFDKAMQEYYRLWQFKHPYPEDFKKILETVSGLTLDAEFALLNKKGTLPGEERKGWKAVTPFSPKTMVAYINNPPKDALLFSPLAGINSYDKFMPGALFTNYKLPPSRFRFLFAPLYATGSKKFNGLAKLNYSFYPDGVFRKVDLFINVSKFSNDEFTKDNGDKVLFGYKKLAPGLRFTLNEKNPRSQAGRYIQWKSFFVNEETYRISYDTVITGTDTSINQAVTTKGSNRTLQQLKFVLENYRVLYPWSAQLNMEHAKDFVRAAFTGRYFFNYPKEGGLDLRLFAGKFFYLGSKTFSKQFATDRYHLNMTGANGYEDYTYSDYFTGRNKFQKLPSQQIMMRDGGFKVRTDLYAEKVGKTDDWLTAVNLTTTLPSVINPLSILPVKIPLKIFLDIGTYADAWKRDAELDRFIFDAGLQLSFFANTVNIYIPLVYSRIYKDYIQSVLEKKGRLLKTISFTIDISGFNLKKINRDFDF
jgi:hypothetical protein